jgi:hypothetical protein
LGSSYVLRGPHNSPFAGQYGINIRAVVRSADKAKEVLSKVENLEQNTLVAAFHMPRATYGRQLAANLLSCGVKAAAVLLFQSWFFYAPMGHINAKGSIYRLNRISPALS